MTLLDLFDRLELTALGTLIRESSWLFPVIEAGHLIGLAILGGAALVLDLRLLGLGLGSQTTHYVFTQTNPWLRGGIALMIATGVPLFLSEAVKCYYSTAFWVKMGALAIALVFTFALRNPVARDAAASATRSRLVGAASLALWLTVAASGRWIGFS